ncbi:hypothetical protein SAY87_006138 [Trapa incisa]|uniref:Protein COFACTOR ASSEMBLY OF COMPLEX C SUBUNIT B CCB3, chloroplastic n=2 Tax=Trapa TaxID=22665 RepID=A0AAN7KTM1_TRANT|nr:hypothetical protein SAY87_006138 [Trapa incisa]KAK4772811.1 hypothetical protein SAY86_014586 [Trapa natans]
MAAMTVPFSLLNNSSTAGWRSPLGLPLKTATWTSFKQLNRSPLGYGFQLSRFNRIRAGCTVPSDTELPLQILTAFSCLPSAINSLQIQALVIGDIDPATAKVAIGILGPFLSGFAFLFIARIVMSWYPKLPVGKFPYVIAYAPTEPILIPTRKVIPPLGGVDVTPVVWFGLISFLNEILVGPQGLLVLLSQQVSS